jgi:predicted HAD superfamily Cof-like phosphohydrolase
MQYQVEEFHRAFKHPVGDAPAIRRPELRVKLIREESKEICDAIEAGDLVEAIDGVCDLLYVTIGAAVEFGVDIEPIFDEVHRSNMAKLGGPTREDGKTLKPEGWRPPDIAGQIDKQRVGRVVMLRQRCDALQSVLEKARRDLAAADADLKALWAGDK